MTNDDVWQAFKAVNERRRAVRDFDGRPIPLATLEEVVAEALKAPSSGNLQPYQLHVVHEPELKRAVAESCNGQRAAMTASALVVVVSSRAIALRTLGQLEVATGPGSSLSERSVAYYARGHLLLRRFFRFAPAHLFGALRIAVSFFAPVLSLLPFGPAGVRHWLARNSFFAAQTLMLAAAARGLDTCPMEGFDAMKVSRLLGLPCGSVVPLVIAVGHRSVDARVEPRLRRSLAEAVVVH
ncbi:hypothetical protein D187_007674 [Cystobacter fuscus DSM 2262]|uniref:Nitroreductase domain-containing protein n=1 Tax=Cystobacter fuscus (strain ATCC 25194 / DSM 2262 / NBRC 100088 / M29) TaxID=1242864 RepID=S9P229_CYSF2|nr:nitroreductase family protein [Cystobacter fuscus]EPX56332.1 hypothetical protein D187_007674 [Cystobacter fuscus DSM 2262]